MASPLGHSSRAQLYKRCSARGWPNKVLAQGSRSFFALFLSRPEKQLNQGSETLCSAYTEFVLSIPIFSYLLWFCAKHCHSSNSRVRSEEKISSETAWAKLTNPQVNLLRGENCKNSTSTPRLMSHPTPLTALQPWSVLLDLTGYLKDKHFRTIADISILKSGHNSRLIWGSVSLGSIQIVTFGKQTLRSKQWCYVRIWEAGKQSTFPSLGRVTCCAWTLSSFSLTNQPGAPCDQGRGSGDTGSSRGAWGTKAKGLTSPHACGMNEWSWKMHHLEHLKPTVKWNSYTRREVCVVPKSGHEILSALTVARAHLFFHRLIKLQQRFDCFKRTEIGNCGKSHSHLCVCEIQQNFSGLRDWEM